MTLAGLAAAVLLGLAVARFGPVMLAFLGGPLIGALLFYRIDLGVSAVLLTLPIEDLIPGIGSATGTRLLGMVVFAFWLVRKVLRRESWGEILKTPLILGSLVFLGWATISMIWTYDRSATVLGLITQVQLVFLTIIIIDTIKTWDHVVWAARLLVLGGMIAALATMYQYFIQGVPRAGDGVSGGINFTASSLVSIMPFAFYLIRSNHKGFWTIASLLYIPLGIVGVIVTFSRASFLLLAFVLALQAWLLFRSRSTRGIMIVLLVIMTVAAVVAVPLERIGERMEVITQLIESLLDPSSSDRYADDARIYHWKVGYAMFKDSPLLGIGFNSFGQQFLTEQFEVRGMPDIFGSPRSPHSSYIGIVTELGLVGIGIFLLILIITARNLSAASRQLSEDNDHDRYHLVRAVYYVLVLQMLYGWVLNTHLNKNFWMILGLSVTLLWLSRGQSSDS